MVLDETRPFAWSARIVEARAFARTSAACLFASTLLPDVIRPKRVSILSTVVPCQLPPRAVGTPLRFNSSASVRRDTKPAAVSFRMVEAMQWVSLKGIDEAPATIARAVELGWVVLLPRAGSKRLKSEAALTDEGRRLARKGR
jgi:hypothetical protein